MTVLQTVDRQVEPVLEEHAGAVLRYFTFFNQGEYVQVADLFTAKGSLHPPFEPAVVGKDSIANYLLREAEGMTVSLLSADVHPQEDNRFQVDVRGSVTALVFKVNVAWCFLLADDNKIESVRVDLLATLEELFRLRPAD
ncbi:MAG: ketosteroid isomerase family protein [Leptolyngbyaceae cyanobacterium]